MNKVRRDRIRATLCSIPLVFLLAIWANPATGVEVLEGIIEQTLPLDSDGSLSLRGTNGSIQIYGGGGTEITLRAIKKAYTRSRLQAIAVDINANQKSIAIETKIPPRNGALSRGDHSGTVDYILVVPETIQIAKLDLVNGEVLVDGLRGGRATAHLVNGVVTVHNCFGDLNFAVVNGRLEAVYDWWDKREFSVRLSSSNGNIRAIMPADASARITARTETGLILNAFKTQKEIPRGAGRSLEFEIQPMPGSTFEMKATSGDIQIDKAY